MDDNPKYEKDWRETLTPGEEWLSVIPYDYHPKGGKVVTVKVVHKTKLHLDLAINGQGARYRVKDGCLAGVNPGASKTLPTPATEEAVAEARKENRRLNMAARLQKINFRELPYDLLETLYSQLPDALKKK